jgi:DNA mismatch repair protein MSH4
MSLISRTTTIQRPRTAQSMRPPSARPLTAASSRPEGSNVLAIIEGRGVSREVGIAVLDRDTGAVMLVQVGLARVL